MFNKITIIGNLGADPEQKESQTGTIFTTFSVGTKNWGEEKTEWFRVVAFGKTAESCSTYLKKGDKVYVEGALRSNEWENDEGIKKLSFSVLCNTIKFLSTKTKEPENEDVPF